MDLVESLVCAVDLHLIQKNNYVVRSITADKTTMGMLK